MVVGTYVGIATVGIFIYWYMWYDWATDGHTLVTWSELTNWTKCEDWIKNGWKVNNFDNFKFDSTNYCEYFTKGKAKASTLSLSVLVTIEMFNAINALSEDSSLL